jgi:D-aspartate ligase
MVSETRKLGVSTTDFLSKLSLLRKPLIIVMSLNQTGLGIVRNFSIMEYEIVGFTKKVNFACSSNSLSAYIETSAETEPERLLQIMVEIGKRLVEQGFVIPTSEIEIRFLSANRDILSRYYQLSLTREEVLSKNLDKYAFYQELRKHSFNSPNTLLLESFDSIDLLEKEIRYPCIIKPIFSGDWKTDNSYKVIGGQKAIVIRDREGLKKNYGLVSILNPKVLLQEIIENENDGNYSFCCYADQSGKVLWGFVTQKMLQYPSGFGTALMCQIAEEPEIHELGKRVIEALVIDGISEVEIVRDKNTGMLHIIEINMRHWLQHTLSLSLGVNLSLLDYYFRNNNLAKVEETLSSKRVCQKRGIWIDEMGYVTHCIKHGFRFEKCHFKLLVGKSWQYSTWSIKDWRPFYYRLKTAIFTG